MTHDIGDLSCRELVELVTEYLEGAMDPAERVRFEHHLVMCRGCAAFVDQMRQTIRITGTLTQDDVPEEAQETLLAAFRRWKADVA